MGRHAYRLLAGTARYDEPYVEARQQSFAAIHDAALQLKPTLTANSEPRRLASCPVSSTLYRWDQGDVGDSHRYITPRHTKLACWRLWARRCELSKAWLRQKQAGLCPLELWEKLGSPSEFVEIPFGLSRYHAYRGEFDLALRLEKDLLRLSRQRNDSVGLVPGHLSSGRTLIYAGRFDLSRSHLEDLLAVYDPLSHRSVVDKVGFYPQGNSQACSAVVLGSGRQR